MSDVLIVLIGALAGTAAGLLIALIVYTLLGGFA